MRKKPTIHELEKILNESPRPIRIYMDGSIGVGKELVISYKIIYPLVFIMGFIMEIIIGSILW